MQDTNTKLTAQKLLDRADEFIIFTNECILADSSYPTIEKMIMTACQQPELKATIIRTIKKIMRNDMLAMLN